MVLQPLDTEDGEKCSTEMSTTVYRLSQHPGRIIFHNTAVQTSSIMSYNTSMYHVTKNRYKM